MEKFAMNDQVVDWYRFYLFGRFILGVSHEIDNQLSVILGYAELMSINPDARERVIKGSGKIIESTDHISSLTKKYSYYARPHERESNLFKVGETLNEVITYAGYDLRRKGVELIINPVEEDISLKGDRRDFALLLLNIIVNGSEAMSEGGGKLSIQVSSGDDYGEVVISDEGKGMGEEISRKVFDPFYSACKEGFHLGLGLTISHYLAEYFGAQITLISKEGKGSIVTVRVPLH